MIRCFRMIFLASLKDAQQSEDYKEYMSSGEGSKLFETKIHRQHVEFLARYPIRKWVGRCELWTLRFCSWFGHICTSNRTYIIICHT